MPMAEDLSVFFSAAEHATGGVLDGVSVLGIFENGYLEVDGIATRGPSYLLPATAVPAVASGSVLVLGAATYRVRVPQPDGTGLVLLPLELQP